MKTNQMAVFFVAATAIVAAAGLARLAAAQGIEVDVRARVPVSCGATVASSQILSITPLAINATIAENCNTRHDLSIVYDPRLVLRPERLFVTYDGQPPNIRTSGAETFTNLAPRNSVKALTIRYSGGTVTQRQQLAQNWRITVTVK